MPNDNLPAEQSNQMTMAQVMQLAIKEKSGVETIEKMMELQERYEKNEAKKAFNSAMAAFKSECPIIPKNSKGQSGKFAGLADIARVVDPLLAQHGLSYRWRQSQCDDKKELTVTCVVTHTGGFAVESPLTGPYDTGGNKNAIQSIGSSNAYLFRYTLNAALGLASAEMDDDGQGSEAEYISEEQLEELNLKMEEKGVDLQMFLSYMEAESLDKIFKGDFKKAVFAIDKAKGSPG